MPNFSAPSPHPTHPGWRTALRRQPDLIFWLCFLILNGLLFAPFFVAGMESAGASAASFGGGWVGVLADGMRRAGLFHLSAEFVLLTGAWVLLARRPALRRSAAVMTPALFLLTLAYHVYEAVVRSVYQMEPDFANQYRFIVDGIGYLAEHVNLSVALYLGVGLGILAGVGGIGLLFWGLGTAVRLGVNRWTRLAMVALGVGIVISAGMWRGGLAAPDALISSLTAKLAQNVTASRATLAQVARLGNASVVDAYDYADLRLATRPNIMLIFVESYGSVLYKRPDYALAYTALLDELQAQLSADGWHTASALSESPTWGGGSWLAYTSTLFGLRIDEHPQYLALLDRFEEQIYPSLGVYLQAQGYDFTWLSTVSQELKDEEWERYKGFYGVDEWLRYRDLGYAGPGYGWGPAPPDQYALHWVRQRLQAQPDPFLLFFITQNSHYPWVPLPEMTADWQTLNQPAPDPEAENPDLIDHAVRRQNYMNAVDYELRMLTELILTETDDNTIYILIGDHQPPRVSRKEDGFETPIHIISRAPAFLAQFEQVGFTPGLTVPENDAGQRAVTLHHEGLYSLLVRALMADYGLPPANLAANLPEFLPNGVQLDSLPSVVMPESISGQPNSVVP